LIVLASVVAVSLILLRAQRYRQRAASLTSLAGGKHSYADGRDVQIAIAGNGNERTAVVLVLHYSTVDPQRRKGVPGRVYSTRDPIEGLSSSWRLTTSYPPDPIVSGVWIDGRKLSVSDRLSVIYISDKVPATNISIGEGEQGAFLADARQLDLLAFVE
jgi:hypothetical protein